MSISSRPSKHAHTLVVKTAREMAHEQYDALMKDNAWLKFWQKLNPDDGPKALEARFVVGATPRLIPMARAALAAVLRTSVDPILKEAIYEALVLDNSLIRGRH